MKEFCVDFKIARELKENGFIQKSEYYYDFKEKWSAPTADEILNILPREVNGYWLEISPQRKTFWVSYVWENEVNDPFSLDGFEVKEIILSNALAKLWIWLKKEGYLKENK